MKEVPGMNTEIGLEFYYSVHRLNEAVDDINLPERQAGLIPTRMRFTSSKMAVGYVAKAHDAQYITRQGADKQLTDEM